MQKKDLVLGHTTRFLKKQRFAMALIGSIVTTHALLSSDGSPRVTLPASFPQEKLGVYETIGQRSSMEDTHRIVVTSPQEGFFALFDGHGGKGVADYAAQWLYPTIKAKLTAHPQKPDSRHIARIFKESFAELNKNILENPAWSNTGTTAVVSLIQDGVLYTAHIGDSRAVLSRKNNPLELTRDHKPNRPDEQKRIEALHGKVVFARGCHRINGSIAVSRAFGDNINRPFVSAEPEISQILLTNDDNFLMLACDGVWDVLSSEDAVLYGETFSCAEQPYHKSAQIVGEIALDAQSTDNISIIMVGLNYFMKHNS